MTIQQNGVRPHSCCEEEQRRKWDDVAAGWSKWWQTIENGAQAVSSRMLDLARVEPGHRVLDIATGIGEPALSAVSRVGPAGWVVATDFSFQMLEIARKRAISLGLTNVEFMAADAQRPNFADRSFDIVLCRWGLTSLPTSSKTLAAIRRMLIPDGSFAAAVWEAGPEARPVAIHATAVAREMFDLPSPRQAARSSPTASQQHALEQELIRAGFRDVRVEPMTMLLDFPSADACSRYLVDVSPELAGLLAGKSSGQQTEYRQRLAEELRRYVLPDGSVRIPNVTVCAAGRR